MPNRSHTSAWTRRAQLRCVVTQGCEASTFQKSSSRDRYNVARSFVTTTGLPANYTFAMNYIVGVTGAHCAQPLSTYAPDAHNMCIASCPCVCGQRMRVAPHSRPQCSSTQLLIRNTAALLFRNEVRWTLDEKLREVWHMEDLLAFNFLCI